MIKKHILTFVAIYVGYMAASQQKVEEKIRLSELPMERVFVHTDKPFYVTGETIWFKAHCTDVRKPGLPSVSKVLYVEMINKEGEAVKQVKILLNRGLGNGQILVTPDLVSDKYQLRAYTSWMKNFNEEGFSKQELCIINPSAPPLYDSLAIGAVEKQFTKSKLGKQKNSLSITLDKQTYGEKEKVTILVDSEVLGNLSLSVYKYHTSLEEKSRLPQSQLISRDIKSDVEVVYPPEIRSPLVSGKISSEKEFPENLFTVFTGSESDIYYTSIDDSGKFYFEVSPNIINKQLLFWSKKTPIDPEWISLDNSFIQANPINLSLRLDTTAQSFLEENVFNIQTSHAFEEVSSIKGKTTDPTPHKSFYGDPDSYYLLDDFTRFKTVRETIVEYIREAFIKKNRIHIYYTRSNQAFDSPALVLLDGVPITEDSLIMDFDPRKIKSIETVNDHYLIGKQIFYGIINFVTFEADYGNIQSAYLVEKEYNGIQQERNFFRHTYSENSSKTNHLPDFRNVLHWEPYLSVTRNQQRSLDFYTSMSAGKYKVELAGISDDGSPLSAETFFEVKILD